MSRSRVLRLCLAAAALGAGLSWSRLPAAPGDPPTFYLVERFGTNFGQVLVHFDTEADRTYTLEYTTNLLALGGGGVPAKDWKTVYTVESIPFANHYVILDGVTNENRFYRLLATP